jgi:ABC-2 type transport system permease protein
MARWWIIALSGIRPVLRKWWFWVLVLLATAPYVLWGFMLFLESRLGPEFRQMVFETAKDQRFATVFLRAYESSLFWIMILALIIGAPSIAADNRTNALQVYLSKPVTKLDYLLGKWASVFVVVMVAMLVPSLLLFLYCLLSFWSSGFLRHEPLLILRVIGAAAITAGGFASLFVGISAWCRSTMVAGAVGAGVYLATQAIASVLWGVLYFRSWQAGHLASGTLVQHCSVGGVMTGLVWNLYGVVLRVPIRHNPAQGFIEVHAPNVGVMLAAYAGLVTIGAIAAYVRVRAVEVVTS